MVAKFSDLSFVPSPILSSGRNLEHNNSQTSAATRLCLLIPTANVLLSSVERGGVRNIIYRSSFSVEVWPLLKIRRPKRRSKEGLDPSQYDAVMGSGFAPEKI